MIEGANAPSHLRQGIEAKIGGGKWIGCPLWRLRARLSYFVVSHVMSGGVGTMPRGFRFGDGEELPRR